MSYSLLSYLVDLEELRRTCGSADAAMKADLRLRLDERCRDLDRQFDSEIQGGAPAIGTALEQLLDGTAPPRTEHGFAYVCALHLLCEHLGQALENEWFTDFHSSYEEAVDEALASRGLAGVLSVGRFYTGEPPVPLPREMEDGGIPSVGYLTPDQARAILGRSTENEAESSDFEVDEGVDQCLGWLTSAVESDRAMVSFLV